MKRVINNGERNKWTKGTKSTHVILNPFILLYISQSFNLSCDNIICIYPAFFCDIQELSILGTHYRVNLRNKEAPSYSEHSTCSSRAVENVETFIFVLRRSWCRYCLIYSLCFEPHLILGVYMLSTSFLHTCQGVKRRITLVRVSRQQIYKSPSEVWPMAWWAVYGTRGHPYH